MKHTLSIAPGTVAQMSAFHRGIVKKGHKCSMYTYTNLPRMWMIILGLDSDE